ncbi:sugar ABC transporter substrate-binding protein [Conexibacter sp. JD483]|uniref:sugar ABC transporter substrate-binding protein n=1 Tax=unclassified Conexibacter TaxID=2627773 RepID=UPI002728F57D|nr:MULTISPECIES: sugar ABC transporter substrate-binding protein [unclassified Conexibacter]MDO8187067.1 sugar ABC transporter substrate-binding protein [Conexibacter sp. CPCC 205706]MDO8200925.1 sugar ABC transporter substrate-binding protein [Conexibacter sp. CPCC 205762]MDR9371307.1 sugar ABC transporter substrate-binding protein [Conexibacter sp. JD483]
MSELIDRLGRAAVALGACAALVVGVAACGSSDDDGASSSADTSAAAAPADTSASEAPAAETPAVSREGIVDFEVPRAGSGRGLKLGFIALGDSVPFSKLVTDGMKRNAEAAGAELVVCDSQLDGQKALDCAKSFKTQGVQGYLNFQVDQKLAGAICAAGPDGPVIAVDIVQKPCQVAFSGAANEYAGFIAGEAMGRFAKDRWDCDYDAYVSLESTASPDASAQRMGGYRKGFQSVCPGELKNEKVLDADRTDTARTKMTDTLTTLPGQKKIVVVALNDDGVLGALAAAKTAGREGDIYVSGQGADPSSWCGIKTNPNWVADTGYFPERYGEIGIPYLIKAVKGERIPEELLVPHTLVTAENVDEIYAPKDC